MYTALPYHSDMIFIETTLFTKLIYDYLSDDEDHLLLASLRG